MKAKCTLRLGLIPQTKAMIAELSKSSTQYEGLEVDLSALNLLNCLVTKDSHSKISSSVKLLNEALAK